MKKNAMKKLFILVLVLASIFVLPSCVITPSQEAENADKTMALINGVYEENVITANFLVEHKMYQESILGGRLNEVTSKGSAVVYGVDKPSTSAGVYTYYLLTNNHVVYENPNYDGYECIITDCYGASYIAEVLYKDANYDLAILAFECREDYRVLSFSFFDPKVEDTVISIGSPLGFLNAVTIGKVKEYAKITLSEDSNTGKEVSDVKFDVIRHDGYVNNGSSGGVLLDENYRICGINYAAEIDDDDNPVAGYAVPITKVAEFLNAYESSINLS